MSNLGAPALRALQSPNIVPHARAPYTVPHLPHLSIASTEVVKCNRWLYTRRIWKLMMSALECRSLCNMLSLLIVLRNSVVVDGFPVEPGYSCQKQICLRSLKVSRKGMVQKTTEDVTKMQLKYRRQWIPRQTTCQWSSLMLSLNGHVFPLTHRDHNLFEVFLPSLIHKKTTEAEQPHKLGDGAPWSTLPEHCSTDGTELQWLLSVLIPGVRAKHSHRNL